MVRRDLVSSVKRSFAPADVPRGRWRPTTIIKRSLRVPGISVLMRRWVPVISRFDVSTPVVALTFDDGPHPEFTPRVARLLDRFGVRATFFVLGEAAAKHPGLVAELANSGHAIGNHSWSHPNFPMLTSRERRQQLRACHRATAPHGRRLFRPPWGKFDLATALDALWLRYRVVGWNVDVGDWWDHDSERMADLLARARPGDIVLLHDAVFSGSGRVEAAVNTDRRSMLNALSMFLERDAHRFRFATISEMFNLGRAVST
jgi:peptidoglycan/xylan/chitin deacetylase (PgdA/CDA1 family)